MLCLDVQPRKPAKNGWPRRKSLNRLLSSLYRKHARNFLDWSGLDCGKGLLQASLGFYGKKTVMTIESCGPQSLSPVAEKSVNPNVERHHEINIARTQRHKEESFHLL